MTRKSVQNRAKKNGGPRRLNKALCEQRPPASGFLEIWDTVVTGFGIRISSKGRRSFMVQTTEGGHRRRAIIGQYGDISLEAARDEARSIISTARKVGKMPRDLEAEEAEAARHAVLEAERERLRTFRAVAGEFIASHVSRQRQGLEVERLLNKLAVPALGDIPLKDLDQHDIVSLLEAVSQATPTQALRLHAVIRKMLNWAQDRKLIASNPAAGGLLSHKTVERDRVLTLDEIKAVWVATDQLAHPFGAFVRVLLLTAQRRGEVAGMRWRELDLSSGSWSVPSERAKAGKGHLAPLPKQAVAILRSLPREGEFVFTSNRTSRKSPGAKVPISGFSQIKSRLDDFTGPMEPWRLHDLRRTAATNMRSLGIDRLTVSKVLNHAEAGITRVYDRYAMDPEKMHAVQRWADFVDSVSGVRKGTSAQVSATLAPSRAWGHVRINAVATPKAE